MSDAKICFLFYFIIYTNSNEVANSGALIALDTALKVLENDVDLVLPEEMFERDTDWETQFVSSSNPVLAVQTLACDGEVSSHHAVDEIEDEGDLRLPSDQLMPSTSAGYEPIGFTFEESNCGSMETEEPIPSTSSNIMGSPSNGSLIDDDSVVTDSLPYEFTPGARINSSLLYSTAEKQLYRIQNKHPYYDRYRCNVKKCPAGLKMVGTVLKKVPNFKEHNHGPMEDIKNKNKFIDSLKREVKNSSASIKSVFINHMKR